MARAFRFSAEVWIYPGETAWHFVSLPQDIADEIDDEPGPERRGFGSRRVEVTAGGTTWNTSIFPDRSRGTFLLPLKKDVRHREGIAVGDRVLITLVVE